MNNSSVNDLKGKCLLRDKLPGYFFLLRSKSARYMPKINFHFKIILSQDIKNLALRMEFFQSVRTVLDCQYKKMLQVFPHQAAFVLFYFCLDTLSSFLIWWSNFGNLGLKLGILQFPHIIINHECLVLHFIAAENRCATSNAVTCTKCLALGPECGWCAQEVWHFAYLCLTLYFSFFWSL